MIHISYTETFDLSVTNIAKNGEVLKPSEQFKSKQACWINIKAELRDCYYEGSIALVQDNTLIKPKVYMVGPKKRVAANGIKPQTPHVPK